MDFSKTPEQAEFYDSILEFARAELNDDVDEREASHRFDRSAWNKAGEYGLLGLSVPEAYGGMELDSLTTCLAIEAFGRGCKDSGLVFSASAHLLAVVMPIVEHGSDAIKEHYLPKLASGEWIGANAITEGEAGSDAFSLVTQAVPDGDDFLLSGSKTYVSNGPEAEVFLVYATTNPKWGYLGIDAFVVDRDTPGLTVGQPFGKMGLHTAPICSIYLEEARVPASNRVGGQGGGATIFTRSMHWERTCLFAGYVGMLERQLEEVVEYASTRPQYGQAIGTFQAISHKIADMKIRLESARMLLYRACWLRDQGETAEMEVAMAKIAVSEAAVKSSLEAIQIFGGIGYMSEFGVERYLRDSAGATIFSGSSEIQRNLIATHLGLPQAPKPRRRRKPSK